MRFVAPSLLHRPTPATFARTLRSTATLVPTLFTTLASPLGGQEPPTTEPVDLAGFIITADRMPREAWTASAATTVIDGAELDRAGIRYVSDALRTVPGVTLTRSGSFGAATSLFLRGGESDYVQVLVDGVQVNDPGGSFDFGSITTDDVERIEVVRGPASALYGSDAVAGVIHIFTKRGRGSPQGDVAFRAGSYGTAEWSSSLHGGTESATYAMTASRVASDGILDFNNGHRATTLNGRITVRPDPHSSVAATVRYQDRRFHFPTDGSGAVVDRNAFTFGEGYTVGVTGSRAWSDAFTTEVVLGLNDLDTGTDDRPDGAADTLGFFAFTSLDRIERRTAEARALWTVRPGTRIAVGYELERQRIRSSSESVSEFGVTPGESSNRRWNRATYLQLTGNGSRAAVNAGIRLEDNGRFGTAATYRGGISWRSPSAGMRLRASAGTSIKEPTFFENFATGFAVGNRDLAPERSRSVEVGWDQEIGSGAATVSLTAFSQRFRDLIQFTFPAPVDGGPNFHNLAEASSRGVEASVAVPLSRVDLEASYTYLDTEVLDSGADEGPSATFVNGEALLRRPAHSLSAGARVVLGSSATLDATIRRVGERSDRDFSAFPAEAVTLPAYSVVDLGASVPLFTPRGGRPGATLSLRLENLFDTDYEEVQGFPSPGRGVYVGGALTLGGR